MRLILRLRYPSELLATDSVWAIQYGISGYESIEHPHSPVEPAQEK